MTDAQKDHYRKMCDVGLKQKRIEFIEFMSKIFNDKKRSDDFTEANERYMFIEDELRNRNILF
jgi:hypothetical protein